MARVIGSASPVGAASFSLQSGLSTSSTGLQALIRAHYSANESRGSVTGKAGAGEAGDGSDTDTDTHAHNTHTGNTQTPTERQTNRGKS